MKKMDKTPPVLTDLTIYWGRQTTAIEQHTGQFQAVKPIFRDGTRRTAWMRDRCNQVVREGLFQEMNAKLTQKKRSWPTNS